jgi:hypothetical protein
MKRREAAWQKRKARRSSYVGSAEHYAGALDVDAIPGVGRFPLLNEAGAVNHDVAAHFDPLPG